MKTHLLLILLITVVASLTQAQLPQINIPGKRDSLNSGASGLISAATHKRLERVHSYMGSENYEAALSLLHKMLKSSQKRPVELAQVEQTIGFVFMRTNKENLAIEHLKKAISLNALPVGPALSTKYMIAQIQINSGQTHQGIASLIDWFGHMTTPSADAYVLLASAYASQKKNKAALVNVEKAISLTNNPKKAWLQFAVALNYELNHYHKAIKYLEVLTADYPEEKKNWKQLSGLYLQTNQDKKALSALEISELSKQLETEAEYLSLVGLFLNREIPYWAAKILQKGLGEGKVKKSKKTLQLLSQCYLQAEEVDQAMGPLKQAAKFSKDGQLFALEGQIFLDKQDWKKAVSAFEQGLKKGGLKNKGQVYVGLGMAQFYLGKKQAAEQTFTLAMNFDKSKKSAKQWLNHLK